MAYQPNSAREWPFPLTGVQLPTPVVTSSDESSPEKAATKPGIYCCLALQENISNGSNTKRPALSKSKKIKSKNIESRKIESKRIERTKIESKKADDSVTKSRAASPVPGQTDGTQRLHDAADALLEAAATLEAAHICWSFREVQSAVGEGSDSDSSTSRSASKGLSSNPWATEYNAATQIVRNRITTMLEQLEMFRDAMSNDRNDYNDPDATDDDNAMSEPRKARASRVNGDISLERTDDEASLINASANSDHEDASIVDNFVHSIQHYNKTPLEKCLQETLEHDNPHCISETYYNTIDVLFKSWLTQNPPGSAYYAETAFWQFHRICQESIESVNPAFKHKEADADKARHARETRMIPAFSRRVLDMGPSRFMVELKSLRHAYDTELVNAAAEKEHLFGWNPVGGSHAERGFKRGGCGEWQRLPGFFGVRRDKQGRRLDDLAAEEDGIAAAAEEAGADPAPKRSSMKRKRPVGGEDIEAGTETAERSVRVSARKRNKLEAEGDVALKAARLDAKMEWKRIEEDKVEGEVEEGGATPMVGVKARVKGGKGLVKVENLGKMQTEGAVAPPVAGLVAGVEAVKSMKGDGKGKRRGKRKGKNVAGP
ncbi:hypothetical protein MMC21_002066 [Puttea exsequens]|nr:hypothetical protein [Puttea exsequens]